MTSRKSDRNTRGANTQRPDARAGIDFSSNAAEAGGVDVPATHVTVVASIGFELPVDTAQRRPRTNISQPP